MEPHPTNKTIVRVYLGTEALSEAAADVFVETARSSVAIRGRFVVGLSGGQTPLPTYRILSRVPYRTHVPWEKTHVFWGDERCVPREDPRNNAAKAFEALLNHVPIPADQIHPVPSDALPQEAADRYEELLRGFFPDQGPCFDLIFLGLGEDGHTASLFPKSPVLDEQERWVKEAYLTEQNMYRVTLTAAAINRAARVAFLVQGRNKSQVLQKVLAGPYEPRLLPAQLVRPGQGELMWLIDEEAAWDLKGTDPEGAGILK